MAGSYEHVCDDENNGQFRFDSIDNLGDAHEACEHMHWMIWHLAGGDRDKIKAASDAYYKRGESNPAEGLVLDEDWDD